MERRKAKHSHIITSLLIIVNVNGTIRNRIPNPVGPGLPDNDIAQKGAWELNHFSDHLP